MSYRDAWTNREQASENKYVREQELAKSVPPREQPVYFTYFSLTVGTTCRLKALKEKLEAQRKNIGELIDNM